LKAPSRVTPVCPRCRSQLEENDYRGSVIDICPQCSGLWLDTGEFDFHTSLRDVLSDEEIPRACPRPSLDNESEYFKCARCEAVMVRRNFRRISGVLIDVCRDHGVWLDAGELEQIRCFIANGGLDKSQDREIQKNSIEIARVAGEVNDLNMVFKTLHRWNLPRILFQGW
jgi:Zn-finger nucleic acid-binding protein